MRKSSVAALACMTALTGTAAGAALATPDGTQAAKVTICHATGSAKNPFVTITVAAPAAFAHTRHQDMRDIVPPFVHRGVTYSQNWDAKGEAIHANGCVAPAAGGGGGDNGEFARPKAKPGKKKPAKRRM